MRGHPTISLIFIPFFLVGCTLYQKPVISTELTPEYFEIKTDPQVGYALNNHWWENFSDPDLNQLVEEALINNYDYLIALKNIDIAQSYVLQNMTQLFPQLGANYELSRNKGFANVGDAFATAPELTANNSIFNLQTLTATVSYELDIWNQVHNSVEQAKSDKLVATGNANVIRLTLISAVVNTYFQVVTLSENSLFLEKQIEAAKEIVTLKEVQLHAGLVDESEVFLAKNQLEYYLSSLQSIDKQRQIYRFTLAYLLGKYPEEFDFQPKNRISSLRFKGLMPDAVPSTMLARRPDIQAAYSNVMSFGYLEKQNIANFLPSLSLSGTYGYGNNTIAHLINGSNALWNYGLSAIQALVDYPALYAQWKRSQIQYESALLNYKNTLVNAFSEVDGAIVSFKHDKASRQAFIKQKDNKKELLGIAKAHYDSGLTDYVDYLNNELEYFQSHISLNNQSYVVTQDVVQIYKTLGLGIDEPHERTES